MSTPSLQAFRTRDWFLLKGDESLRLDYPLSPESIVVDAGGYEGNFAQAILDRYGSRIVVYEPIPAFAAAIGARFQHDARVTVIASGLAGQSGEADLRLDGDASGASAKHGPLIACRMTRASEAIESAGAVDLLKLNVEGAEYGILEDIISSGAVARIRHIQVQFHDIAPDSFERMMALRAALLRTHHPAWLFGFVWDSWTRREDATHDNVALPAADLLRERVARLEREVALLTAQNRRRLGARLANLIRKVRAGTAN